MNALRKWFTVLAVLSMLALIFAGCGGGGGTGATQSAQTLTGQVVDSPIANLAYRTASKSGRTNADGEFFYLPGETVVFSIGTIEFAAVPATSLITPMSLFSAPSITDVRVVNLARLLQTLDTDGNPDNGITISDMAYSAATTSIDFSSLSFDTDIAGLVSSGGGSSTLVTSNSAINHLIKQFSIVGSWLVNWNGANGLMAYNSIPNSYLPAAWTFYPNGTYTAWDSDAGSNCNGGGHVCTAGMEWGTYSYDAVNQTLTVTSTMDQNGANGFTEIVGQTFTSNPGTFVVNGDLISVVTSSITTIDFNRVK